MKGIKEVLDPFVLLCLLVLVVTAYTYWNAFLSRNFPTFTTEEEIGESIEREFPMFSEYL